MTKESFTPFIEREPLPDRRDPPPRGPIAAPPRHEPQPIQAPSPSRD